jgi:hypothetical protein
MPDPSRLSEREKIHDSQTMHVGRPIISRNRLSMKVGMEDGTIRLIIDTTN